MPLVMGRFHIFNPIADRLEHGRLAADGCGSRQRVGVAAVLA